MGATMLARLSERSDVQVVALFEKNEARGREVLVGLGLWDVQLVGDYGAIVDNPDIDAVWIVSPNSYHASQAIAALQSGKHVFCEKPCATTFADYCAEIEAERTHPQLITFVDYILNFDLMEQRLKRMVDDGEFGKVTQVQVNYRHSLNISGDNVWKLRREIMGDAIGMGIIHAIWVTVSSVSSQTQPIGVFATSMPSGLRGFESDPLWNILVRFDNGATGFCFGNIEASNGYDAYHNLFGTSGGFVFDAQLDRPHKVRYWSERSTGGQWVYPLNPEKCRQEGHDLLIWPADATTSDSGNVVERQTAESVAHFIDCVKSGRKSSLGFVNSSPMAEIGWAAQMSAATGKEVALPLDRDEAKRFFEHQN